MQTETMKLCTLAVALTAALVVACDRNTTTTPSPKTDTSSAIPRAAAGSSATPANTANTVQGQVDPKHADQRRDFQSSDDARKN